MSKVTVDLKDAEKDIKKFKLKAKGRAIAILEKEVLGAIQRGVSPVKGEGRFQKYSDIYVKAIRSTLPSNSFKSLGKRVSPVNLKVTGELMKSFFIRVTQNGVLLGFDNFLADIHNRMGAGKKRVIRRLLPTNQGEEFSRSITNKLKESLAKLATEIFKR